MSLFKYDVTLTPSNPDIVIGISAISAKSITFRVDSLQSFAITLNPSGNFAQELLSTTIKPVAQLLAAAIPQKVTEGVKGKTFSHDFDQPIGYNFSVAGVQIDVEADTLNLATYQGMLLVTGTVKVS